MNGKTNIDSINPCSAELDRRTYGFKYLNFSTYGKRLIRIGIWKVIIDLYCIQWRLHRFPSCKGHVLIFHPFGSFSYNGDLQ